MTITTRTLGDAIDIFAVDVHDHLDRDLAIPVLTGLQRQGDVLIRPVPDAAAASPVPAAGVAVVRGENGGNTHLLLADGDVRFDPAVPSTADLTLGTLTVAEAGVAYLAHPEHGYMGIGAGSYQLLRQREQADELRLVAD